MEFLGLIVVFCLGYYLGRRKRNQRMITYEQSLIDLEINFDSVLWGQSRTFLGCSRLSDSQDYFTFRCGETEHVFNRKDIKSYKYTIVRNS